MSLGGRLVCRGIGFGAGVHFVPTAGYGGGAPVPPPLPTQPASVVSGGGWPIHFDPKDWKREPEKRKRKKREEPAAPPVDLPVYAEDKELLRLEKKAALRAARRREEEELLLLGVL